MGREKYGERKEQLTIQNTGSVMARACMAANGTGSLVFIDDVTADSSSGMNSEVFKAILSAHI